VKATLDASNGCVKGMASSMIDSGKGKAVMSVNIVKIIGKTSSIESGPTRAWAPLTSSAKTDNDIANANAESSAMKRDSPRSTYDRSVGANPILAKSTPTPVGIMPVKEFM